MNDGSRANGLRGVLLVLACALFVLQPTLAPLHLALHHCAPLDAGVHSHDAGDAGHDHAHIATAAHAHANPCDSAAPEQLPEHHGDHAPHPAEDHLEDADVVDARPSVELEQIVALPATDSVRTSNSSPPRYEPRAVQAPRAPLPRAAHRPRGPPASV